MNIQKKHVIIGSAGTLVTVLGVVGFSVLTGSSSSVPSPAEHSPQETVTYMASDRFGELSQDQRQEYLEKVREVQGDNNTIFSLARGQLTDEQRHNLWRNIRPAHRRRMNERVNQYFDLAPGEREAFLDHAIDQFQAMRANRRARRPGGNRSAAEGSDRGPRRSRRGHRDFNPERMRNRIEKTDPETRAKPAEFFKLLRKRMEQRGIQFHGPRH